jgi:ATP-dependent DNA helicase RecQ
MKKEDRQEVDSWFMETNTGILSATIAFGMGVDKKNIRTVIHLSIPNEAYDFLQESGRAGRDGKPSKSYVLYYPDDNGKLNDIFKGKDCIRTGLLKHMNETPEETMCISCSSCVESEYVQAGLLEILKIIKRRKILSFKKINSLITRKSIWIRYYIPLWRYENTKIALSDLLFNGYIKRIFNSYYALKANGRKLLKEKRRR